MRILTYYSPSTNKIYCSIRARNSSDYAIEDRPSDIPDAQYNPETNQWEVNYETGDSDVDITIAEAEALWSAAKNGDLIASAVLKLTQL